MIMFRTHLFLMLGVLFTPFALLVLLASAGFGHGNYVWARIVLPFTCAAMGLYPGVELIF